MDLKSQVVALNKKIEKIQIKLTQGTALSVAKRASLIAEKGQLQGQLTACQAQLPTAGIKKIVHL